MFYLQVSPYILWGIVSAFYAFQYILRVMPSIMLTDITERFNVTPLLLGQFSGVYYIAYALLHLPLGRWFDRYGPKRILPLCLLLTIIGTWPLMSATHWVYLLLGRAAVGAGSSAAILGAFKVIKLSFKEKDFTRMLSFSVTIGLLGAIYGGGPLRYMSELMGYQAVIKLLLLLGISLAITAYLLIPDRLDKTAVNITAGLKQILSNCRVRRLCLAAGLMVGPLEGFADVWGVSFLKQVYHLEQTQAATLTSLIFLGMGFGGPLLSWLSEKTQRHLVTITASAVTMAISFGLLLSGKLSILMLGVLFIIVGICSSYQILSIYKVSTYVPSQLSGFATSVANMIIMSFGYAFHTSVGALADSFAQSKYHALSCGIAVIPLALIIGALIMLSLIWERKPNNSYAKTSYDRN